MGGGVITTHPEHLIIYPSDQAYCLGYAFVVFVVCLIFHPVACWWHQLLIKLGTLSGPLLDEDVLLF